MMRKKTYKHIALLFLLVFITPIVVQNLHIILVHPVCEHCVLHLNKDENQHLTNDNNKDCPICKYELVVNEKPDISPVVTIILPSKEIIFKYIQPPQVVSVSIEKPARGPPLA